MHDTHLNGRLQQFVGQLQEYWGKLSHTPARAIAGRKTRFTGKIRAQRALSRTDAARQLSEFHYRHRHWKITG